MRSRRMAGGTLAMLISWMAVATASAEQPDAHLRDRVEESLASNFVRPQTTIWRFDAVKPYFGSDRVVCGWVNYESAAQKYLGFHQFYAIVNDDRVKLSQIADPAQDTSGKLADKLAVLCGKA